MEKEVLVKMTVIELSRWLENSGIQGIYCELFEGINLM